MKDKKKSEYNKILDKACSYQGDMEWTMKDTFSYDDVLRALGICERQNLSSLLQEIEQAKGTYNSDSILERSIYDSGLSTVKSLIEARMK